MFTVWAPAAANQGLGAGGEAWALDHHDGAGRGDLLARCGEGVGGDAVQRRAERFGGREVLHRTAIVEGVCAPVGAVDELVGEHERAGRVLLHDPADGGARHDGRTPSEASAQMLAR